MKPAKALFTLILFCHCFLLEDAYGYWHSLPSPLYRQLYGFSVMTAFYVVLGLLSLRSGTFFSRRSRSVSSLGLATALSLMIAVLYTVLSGGYQGANGTGLLEVRSAVVMAGMYLVFRCYFSSFSPENAMATFRLAGAASAVGFTAIYLLKLRIMETGVNLYGRSTAFESGFLSIWLLLFCYSTARLMLKAGGTVNGAFCIIFGAAVIFSFRRFFILCLLLNVFFAFALFPARTLWARAKRILLTSALLAALLIVTLWARPDLRHRLSLDSVIDPTSADYVRSYSSNIGHTRDIEIGLELIRKNPVFGIGLGVPISGTDQQSIVDTVLHSQPLHFWVRMGAAGFLLFNLVYLLPIMRALGLMRQSRRVFDQAFGLAIATYMASSYLMSVIAPPLYLFQKQQFLYILILATIETRRCALSASGEAMPDRQRRRTRPPPAGRCGEGGPEISPRRVIRHSDGLPSPR